MRQSLLPFISMLFLLTSSACRKTDQGSTLKVVGGQKATQHGFMLGLLEPGAKFPYCGASLLAPGFAVTAAHCVHSRTRTLWIASAEELSRDPSLASRHLVTTIDIHPEYNPTMKQADLALLSFDPGSQFSDPALSAKQAIGLDPPAQDPSQALVLGWGTRSSYGYLPSQELQIATVPIISLEQCLKEGGRYSSLGEQQICAGYLKEGGVDSCQGDSGGPLFFNDTAGRAHLLGVVSWGEGCAQAHQPGVYARISSYRSWLEETMKLKPNPELDSDGKILAKEVVRHCYDRLHGKLTSKQDEHLLIVASHVRSLDPFQAISSAPELTSAPACEWTVGSDRVMRVFQMPVGTGFPHEQTIIVEDAQQHKFYQATMYNSLRTVIGCDFDPKKGGNPSLVLDAHETYLRQGEQTFEWVAARHDPSSEPRPSAPGSRGCAIGDVSLRILEDKPDPTGETLEVEVKAPTVQNGERIFTLRKVKRPPHIELKIHKLDDYHGQLQLHNTTKLDIIAWRLDCDHSFAFEEAKADSSPDPHYEEKPAAYHEYSSPDSPWRILRKGETRQIAYRSETPFKQGEPANCRLNALPVDIREI